MSDKSRKGKVSSLVYAGGRSVEQREADLVDIAERYLHGWRQVEILTWLNENREYKLASTTLGAEIQELHRRWMAAHILDFDAAKSKELERIDVLERAYWEGYERSTRTREEHYEEEVRDEQMGVDGRDLRGGMSNDTRADVGMQEGEESGRAHVYTRTKTKHKKMERDGSVAFLQGVERCIGLRCAILGLNAPAQLNISWRKDAKQAGIDPDEMKRNMIRQYVGRAKASLMAANKIANEVERTGEMIDGEMRDLDEEEGG